MPSGKTFVMEPKRAALRNVQLVLDLFGCDQFITSIAWAPRALADKAFPGGVGGSGRMPERILSRMFAAKSLDITRSSKMAGLWAISPSARRGHDHARNRDRRLSRFFSAPRRLLAVGRKRPDHAIDRSLLLSPISTSGLARELCGQVGESLFTSLGRRSSKIGFLPSICPNSCSRFVKG